MSSTANQKKLTTKLAVTGMLTALAVALQFIEFSIPIVPSFIKFDLSDLPELICTFALGPVWGLAVCFLKNLIHMPFGSTAGVGELANFVLGAAFVLPAGFIYQRRKTRKNALIACAVGALTMAAVSFPLNYFAIYPLYTLLGFPMEAIVGMYKTILPSADELWKCLLIFNVPFTLAKGVICSILSLIIYKPISKLIVKLDGAMGKSRSKA